MPPRRRASQKESDERLSVAETIAGLANSIEHPAFSPRDVTARRNSYDDKAAADFARLPSMVIDELNVSAVLPMNSSSLPLPAHTVSFDGVADTADHGHVGVGSRKLKSRRGRQRARVQSQPSTCSGNVIHHSQPTSTVHTPTIFDSVVQQQAVTAGCPVSVPFNGDAMFGAVMVGWNPPVLASCPSGIIDPASPDEVSSPLSALRTVDLANSDSNVLKLPLVLSPMSDGTWQLVPVSASDAFGANLLPHMGCIVQTIAQQGEVSACSGGGDRTCSQPLSSSMTQAVVGAGSLASSELLTAVNSSQGQLHSGGSLSMLRSYDNGPVACASTVTSGTCQELSGSFIRSDPSMHNSVASSSEDAVSGSSSLGSLGALRDYYKRISTSIVQSTSVSAADIQMLNSAARVSCVGNNKLGCTDSKLPAISASVSNNQVVQPVLCINSVSTDRNDDVQTNLNVKPVLVSRMSDANWSPRTNSRVLPAITVGQRQTSPSDSTNKQLLTESHCNLRRSAVASELFADGGQEQSSAKDSCKPLQHLPLKKRQKVSIEVHYEAQQNGIQRKTSGDVDNKQIVDDSNKNVDADPADILLSEEVIAHTELPSSANVAFSGTLLCRFLE